MADWCSRCSVDPSNRKRPNQYRCTSLSRRLRNTRLPTSLYIQIGDEGAAEHQRQNELQWDQVVLALLLVHVLVRDDYVSSIQFRSRVHLSPPPRPDHPLTRRHGRLVRNTRRRVRRRPRSRPRLNRE